MELEKPLEAMMSPTRSLPYAVQVVVAAAIILLTSLTAIIFLTSNARSEEAIEDFLERIDERIRVNDERLLCILQIPPEGRNDAAVEACEP